MTGGFSIEIVSIDGLSARDAIDQKKMSIMTSDAYNNMLAEKARLEQERLAEKEERRLKELYPTLSFKKAKIAEEKKELLSRSKVVEFSVAIGVTDYKKEVYNSSTLPFLVDAECLWSPFNFVTAAVGLGGIFSSYEENKKTEEFIYITTSLGLLYPFTKNSRLLASFFLKTGWENTDYADIIRVVPGFSVDLVYIFKIRYQGFIYDNQYVNALSVGYLISLDWGL